MHFSKHISVNSCTAVWKRAFCCSTSMNCPPRPVGPRGSHPWFARTGQHTDNAVPPASGACELAVTLPYLLQLAPSALVHRGHGSVPLWGGEWPAWRKTTSGSERVHDVASKRTFS